MKKKLKSIGKLLNNFVEFWFLFPYSSRKTTPSLHPITLRFVGKNSNLEKKYIAYFKETVIRQSQLSHFIAIFFFSLFAFLDFKLAPNFADTFLLIRIGIAFPLILISLFFTTRKIYKRFMQPTLSILAVIVGFGIIIMINIGGPGINSVYFVGIILVFIAIYTFVGLQFPWALMSTWLLVILYEIVSIYQKLPPKMLITNNYFLLSALLFSMIAGYSIEFYRRNMYYTNYLLKLGKNKITLSNIDLEKKVNERTVELVKAKEEAEKADKIKSIFLAQMSHEIRTPLNAIMSSASILRYDLEENANEDEKISLDIIDKAGKRIIRTIDLLLNFSEIQSGTYKPYQTKFDLYTEVIVPILADNKVAAKNKNIKLSLLNSVQKPELIADHYTVLQIFTHLLDNALKYTREGEVTIKIFYSESDKLTVEIKDTGIGIDKRYLVHLFQPFSQEEMGYTRTFDGNGIGLALVKKYCELNNAEIDVESKKDTGTTFRVTFN